MSEIGEKAFFRVKLESQKFKNYVSLAADRTLVADRASSEGAEIFRIIQTLEEDRYAILPETSNFKFVSMGHSDNMLKANKDWILKHEVFMLQVLDNDAYALKSLENNKYVSVRDDNILRASGDKPDKWEKFHFVHV
ncbi:MAG: hypothetical protein HPY61_13655 [Methanotrichaceae archaeon]|nr:hypothetical protein [Methanotrichaceae archaeon]